MVKPSLIERCGFLIYPNSCMCCSAPIDSSRYTCERCTEALRLQLTDKVRRFSYHRREVQVCSVYSYDKQAASAIKRLKFDYNATSARPLGIAVANRVRRLRRPPFEVVCSVPMTARARAVRGFNQAELIARYTARELGVSFAPRAISKIRETAEQHTLQGSDRKTNVRNAYLANPKSVAGKRVLLVDDVVTTGATLCECVSALQEAGALSVYCATVASAAKV